VLTDLLAVSTYWSGPAFGVNPSNQSVYGLLLRLFSVNPFTVPLLAAPALVVVGRVAVTAAVLLVLGAGLTRSRDHPARTLALEFGLCVVGMLLVSPLSEDLHYTYLVLPLTAVLVVAGAGTRWRRGAGWPAPRAPALLGAAALAVYVYLSLPTLRSMKMAYYRYYAAPVGPPLLFLTGVHVYGLCALFAVALLLTRWQRRRAGPAPR
jgi:hypothetical protein